TLARDGWRFQPEPELPYQLQCRGQVTPASRLLVTEVFVEEVVAGPVPTLYADLLCTVDGLKAFHARRGRFSRYSLPCPRLMVRYMSRKPA
ncbi:MAG: hypothetical protein IH587_05730, partial [Anaerolineae bacterium]|nr:hypothetical protein [Anaerolineae bacterium]